MTGITPIFDVHRKERFLALLAEGDLTVAQCATAVGVSPTTPGNHRRTDADFAAAWADAIERHTDKLETVARRRALVKSDVLMMFLLKAARPEVYAERTKVENRIGGIDGGPLDDVTIAAKIGAILDAARHREHDAPEDDLSEFA